MKKFLLLAPLTLLHAGAAVVTTFEEETLPAAISLDVPRPASGNIVFDPVQDELDFTAAGNTDMWSTRNGAAIAWTAAPAPLAIGDTWIVETEVRLNNVTQNNQVAGLTFYGGPDGARPDITYGLDNWDPSARAVRLQGLGDNVPNASVPTSASRVFLRVVIEEGGSTDTCNYFFRENPADAWTQIPGAAVNHRTSFPNSRVGLTYKTGGAKAGAAFSSFYVLGASNQPPIITSQPIPAQAVLGGVARFQVSELGAQSYQWRRGGLPLSQGGDQPALVLDPVTAADGGTTYDCVLTNASGSTTTTAAGLTVSAPRPGAGFHASAVLAEPSLFAFFPVDDSLPAVLTNAVNPGFSGTLGGSAAHDSTPDRTVGTKSLSSDGNGWVALSGDPSWELADGSGTIELFAYHAAGTTYRPGLVSVRNGTGVRYALQADAAGARIHLTNGSTNPSWTLPTSSIGRLMHLVLVMENGQATLYHNGENLGTLNQALGGTGQTTVSLASMGPGAQESFPGNLDAVAAYAEPLPAAAVTAHYQAWLTSTPGAAPVITAAPAAVSVDEGGTASFSVTLADTTDAVYRWQRNGSDVAGATTSTLVVAPVTLADQAAVFQCIIYNRHGGTRSQPALLTVNDTTAPALVSASSPLSATRVLVTFNESVTPDGARFLVPGGTVTAAVAGPLPGQLTLTVAGLTPGQTYSLTAQDVRDHSGNTLATAESQFTAAPRPVPAPVDLVRPAAEPAGPATRRGPFVLSEIHYHPPSRPDGKNLEFIEVYNSQPWIEDISGFRLEGEVAYTMPPGTLLPAGGRLVIAAAPDDVISVHGLTRVLGPWRGALSNGGGEVRLHDISNAVVFSVNYRTEAPWPAAPDGSGHSLVLARPSYGMEDARSWDQSFLPDGSPGAAEPDAEDPYRPVLVNEIMAAPSTAGDFIELYNYSTTAIALGGCSLSDSPATAKFILPAETVLPPGTSIHFPQSQLGFGLKTAGDTVYFRAPAGPDGPLGRVLEAVRFGPQLPGTSHGRHPDAAPQFSALQAATPGAPNTRPATKPAVISEIHYQPPTGNPHPPFVEITNLSETALDLGGWRLSGGVRQVIPTPTVLAPGASLALTAFSGSLNKGAGERLRLEQPVTVADGPDPAVIHPVVDEVTYGTGGRWGRWSKGGGSSLERQDLHSDSRLAATWADSDETAEGGWVTIETTGPLVHGSGSPINRLHVMLLGAGECLLDDVEVIPQGGRNLVANGGFENGDTHWLRQGTHETSAPVAQGFTGNRSLHVRATGRGNLAGNRLTVPLATPLAIGTTATLRARVKWLHGHPEIVLRLQGGSLEAAGNILPASLQPGTPGAANSRAVTNAGPAISDVTHRPVLPQAGQPVTVFARLNDPDDIVLAQLHYRLDPSTTRSTITMTARGGGLYSAELPAQPGGRLAAFTLTAYDSRSARSSFPDDTTEALIRWGEPATPPGALGTYRLWMTEATRSTWTNRLKNSNTPLDVTFLYGDSRVIYNATAQYSGSPWHTGAFTGPTGAPCDYDCTLPGDDRLLGTTDFLFAGPGTFGDDTSLIREQTIWWMARRLGLPSLHRRFGRVYVNGTLRQRVFEDAQQPNGEWIDTYWPDDDEGRLHKAQDWIEYEDDGTTFQTTLRALLTPFTTPTGDHQVSAYRYQWAQRSAPGSANDWSAFTSLVDAFNTGATATDPAFFRALDPLVDEHAWARALAIQRISGNWDTWGWRFGKNMYLYKPERGPWAMTAWDIDFSFGLVGESATFSLFDDTQDPLCVKFRNQPAFRRAYWSAYRDAVDGPMLASQVNTRIDAMVAGLNAHGIAANASQVSAVKSYISTRRNYIVNQLNTVYQNVTFALTGPPMITDDDGSLTLTGTAPPGIVGLRLNGVDQVPTWTSQTAWRLPVTVYQATNTLTVEGIDRHQQSLGSFPVTITVTGPPPVRQLTLNEWMAANPPGTGLADPADGKFDDWFEIHHAGTTAIDVSGYFLSDTPEKPTAFEIPAGTVIPPGGYLLVWADGQPEQNGGPAGHLHTNFQLSAAGESIRLTHRDGTLIDAITFGPQVAGVAEGRYPEGGAIVGPLTLPTPAGPNAKTEITGWSWLDSSLQFSLQTTPGLVYQLETSRSLDTWSPAAPPQTATGSTLSLQDPAADPATPRFYRVLTTRP